MAVDPRRVQSIFLEAVEFTDPAERRAVLDRTCGADLALRERVEALLRANDRSGGDIDRPIVGLREPDRLTSTHAAEGDNAAGRDPGTATDAGPLADSPAPAASEQPGPTRERPGAWIGPYKLLQEIGEGGMGTVFMAEQERPVRRQLALKLIKPGMNSRNVLARFDSERQALALMDHPNIARVFKHGSTDSDRPYFVMELVRGIPLTEYCDRHSLSLPERLALFRPICSAVQHAHQKGIIHRDLKPTNILVESHDGRPVPKVIDFGLAKATGGFRLTEQSLFTAFGGVAGTPLYMAPEQATWSALDVDTRADVYALGVILYEVLTGTTPITRESMQRAALDELFRVIREVDPPAPSSRISTSEALPSLAASRRVEPARLSRLVRGDLDWIVMKALAKERDLRYASAIGLADDIERYLDHQPVSAGPPTAAYRLRKFVRRHRIQLTAAALVLLALVLGVVGTTLGLFEARRQQRIAVGEAKAKERALLAEADQRRIADEARRQAEKRLSQVQKMNEILGSIFKDLNPENSRGDGKPLSAILGERLERATAEIEGEATGDPLTVARMQMTLGVSLAGLGYPDRAIAVLSKAHATLDSRLGPDHPATLASMNNLANSYYLAGQYDRATKLGEETVARMKSKFGPDHPELFGKMNNLAAIYQAAGRNDQALKLLEETLALTRTKLGPDHPDTVRCMHNLASSYEAAGQNARATKLREEVLALSRSRVGPDHPATLRSMSNLATSYFAGGQHARATKLREETLALSRSKLGPDHGDTVTCMADLACSYLEAGQYDRATKLFEEALPKLKMKLGADHPDTLGCMQNLAHSYSVAGQNGRAMKLLEEALTLTRTKLGPDHPQTLAGMNNLAIGYGVAGQYDRALKLREETQVLLKAKFGPDHPQTLSGMNNLANSYAAVGQNGRALKLHEETLALAKTKLGPDHPDTLRYVHSLANSFLASGRNNRALTLYEETLVLMKSKLGPDHPDTLRGMQDLALSYLINGQSGRAITLLEETLTLMKSNFGPDHPEAIQCMGNLAASYSRAGQNDRAKTLLEATLPLMESKFGPDHLVTLRGMSTLATSYYLAGQNDRAMKLFEQSLALMRTKLGPDHPDTILCMNNLALSDEAVGRTERALKLYDEALALAKTKLGPDHPTTFKCLEGQARCLANSGQIDRAGAILDEVIASRRKAQGDGRPETLEARLARAGLDLARGRLDTAEATDRAILDECRGRLGADDKVTIAAGLALARVLESRGDRDATAPLYLAALESARRKPSDRRTLAWALTESGRARLAAADFTAAEAQLREAVAIREAEMAPHWLTAEARSLLGEALLRQNKIAEAAPLLRSGYQAMDKQAAAIPLVDRPRLAEALDRLIAAGEAAGSKAEVVAWKAARVKLGIGADPEPKSEGK